MTAAFDAAREVPAEPAERILEIGFSKDPLGLQVGQVADLRCFRKESFDKVIGIGVIQSWGEAIDDIYELRRVLRPGGHLVLGFERGLHVDPLLGEGGFEDIRKLHRVQGGPETTWTGARRSG